MGTRKMLSSVQMYPHINWATSALFFFGRNVEIRPRPLRFAVPAGSNKLQTCFLSSNSTFAAPSLRHRPYHYPHKQQKKKCLCNLGVGGISPPAFCQPPLSAISVVETSTECTKSQRKSTLVMNAPVFFVPCEEDERMRTCEDLLSAD